MIIKNIKKIVIIIICSVSTFDAEFLLKQDNQIYQKDASYISKTIVRPGCWDLRHDIEYHPTKNETMLHVKSSGVTVDFHDYTIKNKDSKLVIGVEVGYSQAELNADSSLQQVSNVVIKNGFFSNFDVGIVVHQGVNSITIENCSFDQVSHGIVFLGTNSFDARFTVSAKVVNCNIIGHGQDRQTKLMQFKNWVEEVSLEKGGMGYGSDAFISLYDQVVSNTTYHDIYTYTGVIANYVKSLTIDNLNIQNIGYQGYTRRPEDDLQKTCAVGLLAKKVSGLSIKNSYIYSCASEIQAIGIKIDSARNIVMKNIDCTHQRSACRSYSIALVDDSDYENRFLLRERTIMLQDVYCQLNTAQATDTMIDTPEEAVGLYIHGLYAVSADNLQCLGNTGKKKSYGMFATYTINSLFKNSSFNNNKSSRAENDVVSEYGIAAVGCYINNSENLNFKDCCFSHNFGLNTGIGCVVKHINSISFDTCHFSDNKGIKYKLHELGSEINSIRFMQDTQEVSNYGPIVSAADTGGYGLLIDDTSRIELLYSKAQNNIGHRSVGFLFKDSKIIAIDDSSALYQYASGNFIHDDITWLYQKTNYEIPILDIHKDLLFDVIFSDKFTENKLNLHEFKNSFLQTVAAMRDNWSSGKFVSLDMKKSIIRSLSLLFGSTARFKVWGIAFGVHMHSCHEVAVKNSKFSGQIAECDSAAGFVVTGRSSHFYIRDCELSYNYGWRESQKMDKGLSMLYPATYNLSSIKSLWDILYKEFDQAVDTVTAGFLSQGLKLIAQGQKELDGTGNDIGITMNRKKYPFVNMIAPVSGGLIVADNCHSGTIAHNQFHANKGNAGYTVGLLFHAAEGFLVQDNSFDDNASNIYGHCCGLIDMNLFSENNYLRNRLSSNSVDGFHNSHSLIVSDSRNNLSAVYPLARFNDGVVTSKVSEIDNVEINLPSVNYQEKKESKKQSVQNFLDNII